MRLMQNTLTLVATMMGLSALGPRPFYLVDQMEEGELKNKLVACVADIERYTHHDSRSGIAGQVCSFRSIPRSPTKRAVGWGRTSSSAT